jgi:hypothetical protein
VIRFLKHLYIYCGVLIFFLTNPFRQPKKLDGGGIGTVLLVSIKSSVEFISLGIFLRIGTHLMISLIPTRSRTHLINGPIQV